MKAANIAGALVVVVLVIILMGMLFWYDNTTTGASVVETQKTTITNLQTELTQRNQQIASLTQENTQLKNDLSGIKKDVEAIKKEREDAIAEVAAPAQAPAITQPTTQPTPSTSGDIDLTAAREDLSLRTVQRAYEDYVQESWDVKAKRLIDEKIASIVQANLRFRPDSEAHRIVEACRIDDTHLLTKRKIDNFDEGVIWSFDHIDLGTLISMPVPLSDAGSYEKTLTCVS
ncbi:hypothetical protein J4457_06190 [Candidatus Woesearchaeota archaeon]|nr:hypothetical protein [Candidatus Woesearchaeota archaeon]